MATWKFDPAHSMAEFSVRHMMVTTVRGTLKIVEGTLHFDPSVPAESWVEAKLDAASIFTGVEDRDNHLRSADFLDAANHPYLTFKSTRVEVTGEQQGRLHGDLTIRGVTRPVTLEIEYLGQEKSPFGDQRVGFTGSAKINREDFGLTWNMALESGGVLVGKEVKIALDVEAVLVTETAAV